MSKRQAWAIAAMLGVGLVMTCVRTTPQPPPEPPPPPAPAVVVPEGCLESQAGPWQHALDPSWRYEATDDGGALTLVVHHRAVVDAGFRPRKFRRDAGDEAPAAAEDAGANELPAARIELLRTDAGFLGATLTRFTHPAGRACELAFPTRVLACADGGLTLETLESLALGDACQPPAQPGEVARREHHLIKLGFDGG